VTGEIFPLKARARGLSMTTASNWLLNWAIAYSTPYMVNPGPGNANLGSKVFFIWGGFCLICELLLAPYSSPSDIILQASHSYTSASMRPKGYHSSKSTSCTPSAHRHGSRRTSSRLSVSPISPTRTPQPLAAALWRSLSNLLLVGSRPLGFMWRSRTIRKWLLIASMF
jgi:hypothetical protein